ncbi:ATP-binding protein [Thermodesulfobacteriota bacterium]
MQDLEIIKHCAAAIFIIDPDHKVMCWNTACEELTGIKASELLGTDKHWKAFYTNPQPCLCDYIVDGGCEPSAGHYLIYGESTLLPGGWHAEDWFDSLGGKERYIIFDAVPIYNSQGKMIMVVQTIEDITHHKKAEEELAHLAKHLEQKNRELSDFNRIVSHDLKEPLALIQAFNRKLTEKCGPYLGESCQEYLKHIGAAASRMQDLIDGLLNYSRVTTQAQPFSQVDLEHVVSDVLDDLEARIDETRGRIELEKLVALEADPLQMRQLLMNLIGNALKYHQPGATPNVRIHSEIIHDKADQHDFCRIVVEDNGIGFPEKDKGIIFEAFQRLHSRKEYEGAGIGLSICKKIVDRHGGKIRAEGAPGKGAVFTITLPLRQK